MQAKKKNRKNAKTDAAKQQAMDEDDAVLEAALGEKQRLLTAIERKREDAMGQDLARRLQEEEWAAADAGAAAVSRTRVPIPAHSDGDAELAAAIAATPAPLAALSQRGMPALRRHASKMALHSSPV